MGANRYRSLWSRVEATGADLGELVERHERQKAGVDFTRWANDPVGFIRDVLKGKPWSVQEEIALAVRDEPLVVVRSCNAAGKDWIAAHLALWWVYCRQGLVLLTGPTERQVREIVMGEVGRAFHRARDLPGELFRMALRIPGEEAQGILAFTSSEASRLTGFHAPRVLVVITEAQGVEDFAYEGMLACATGDEDRLLAVGNPLRPSGKFYEVCKSWRSFHISAEDHPNITGEGPFIPGGPTLEFRERLFQEYGQGSGIVQSRWYGEFPEQGEEALFSRAWINAAVERWPGDMAMIEADRRRLRLEEPWVAVDPARYGPDSTALAIRRGYCLEGLITWNGLDTMATADKAAREAAKFGVRPGGEYGEPWGRFIVDTIGLGAGVYDRLRQMGYRVRQYNGGFQPYIERKFFNRRAEAYWMLRDRLEAGTISLPKDEGLADELLSINWRPTADGRVQLESKEDLKRRLGHSPDKADAVVMAFFPGSVRTVSVTTLSWY